MPRGSRPPYQGEASWPVEDSSNTLLDYIVAEVEPSLATICFACGMSPSGAMFGFSAGGGAIA
eukprot:5451028-Pyramimonas_sp.AAC.1